MNDNYHVIKQQIIEIYFDSSREYYLEQGKYKELVEWADPHYTVEMLGKLWVVKHLFGDRIDWIDLVEYYYDETDFDDDNYYIGYHEFIYYCQVNFFFSLYINDIDEYEDYWSNSTKDLQTQIYRRVNCAFTQALERYHQEKVNLVKSIEPVYD
jgi:hypothetical protein